MIQATLDNIKRVAAEIAIQYTNGKLNAMLSGGRNVTELSDKAMRTIYLWGVIDYAYLVGEVVYIGGTAVSDTEIYEARDKLYKYNGMFNNVDLSEFSEITSDDGEGGSTTPPSGTQSDTERVGEQAVVQGANLVTFTVDGVPSPLESSNYIVIAWVETYGGSRQSNLQPSTYTASGFVVDVIEAGILKYQAQLIT